MPAEILILNGPNLNILGTREPEVYGSVTLEEIRAMSEIRAAELGLTIDFRQSNSEGDLIDWIQSAPKAAAGIIINAGAYTHTSVALLDALRGVNLPIIEVHLSNIFKRETYRHHSFVSQIANGLICGFGGQGYELALDAMNKHINRQ